MVNQTETLARKIETTRQVTDAHLSAYATPLEKEHTWLHVPKDRVAGGKVKYHQVVEL